MEERLFVYSTLGPNRPNEHILKNIRGSFEEANVTVILYDKGWGSEMGYPGIILDTKGIKVKGFLFSSYKINKYWSELDEFEGGVYERVLTEVEIKKNYRRSIYLCSKKKI